MPLVNPTEPPIPREPAQVTLSTIGDVSLAVSDSMRRPNTAGGMSLLVASATAAAAIYLLSVLLAAMLGVASPIRWWAPLFPSACAAAVLFLWQRAKAQARAHERELAGSRKAIERLAYEASNAANAIRANLIGHEMDPEGPNASAHVKEIGAAVERLCESMQRSAGS